MSEESSKSLSGVLGRSALGGPLLVLITLFTFLGRGTSDSAKEDTKKPSAEVTVSSKSGSEKDALTPLREYLDLGGDKKEADSSALIKRVNKILIATLPDPRRTLVASQYDGLLEATRRAIESQGYIYDRSYFPWDDDPAESNKDSDKTQSHSDISAEVDWVERPNPVPLFPPVVRQIPALFGFINLGQLNGLQFPNFLENIKRTVSRFRISFKSFTNRNGTASEKKEKPARLGSVLFRSTEMSKDKEELLMLFIVPESPTSGIDKHAMRQALEYFALAKGSDLCAPVKIIGPTFSGSAQSLAKTIGNWRTVENTREVWVCSGSATNVDKGKFQTTAGGKSVRYAATVHPAEDVFKEIVSWLRERNGDKALSAGKVALLVEGGTGFAAVREDKAAVGEDKDKHSELYNCLRIKFPLHISQLRGTTADKMRDPIVDKQSGHVPIPIDEIPDNGKQDSLPAFTPKMTAATDYLLITNILTTLKRERIRYVGILATDKLDVIYLARLIHLNCPDTQIILLGSDLRYTDAEYTVDLRGALVGSSYPLDPSYQSWCYPQQGNRSRQLFLTDSEMGTYNAALVVLTGEPKDSDELKLAEKEKKPFIAFSYPFFGSDKTPQEYRPAIWINQVGQQQLVALSAKPVKTNLIPALQAGSVTYETQEISFPLGFRIVIASLSLLSCGLLVLSYQQKRHFLIQACSTINVFRRQRPSVATPSEEIRNGSTDVASTVKTDAEPYHSTLMRHVSPWLMLNCSWGDFICRVFVIGSIFVSLLFVTDTEIVLIKESYLPSTLFSALLTIPGIVACAVLFSIEFLWFRNNKNVTDRRSLQHTVFILGCLSIVLIVGGVLFSVCACDVVDHPADRVLCAIRNLDLASGLSPILPVLFFSAGFFLIGWLGLIWFEFQEKKTELHDVAKAEDSKKKDKEFGILYRTRTEILMEDQIKSNMFSLENFSLAVSLLGLLWAWGELLFRGINTLDFWWSKIIFISIIFSFLLIMCYMLRRFLLLRRNLSAVFHSIIQLPIGQALDRLPKEVKELFGRFILKATENEDIASRALKQAKRNFINYISSEQKKHSEYRLAEYALEMVEISPEDVTHQRARESAEDYLATFLVLRLQPYGILLRKIMLYLTICPLLLLLAARSYPFQPQGLIGSLIWVFIAIALLAIFYVYSRVDRNEFVSRVSGTKANEVTFDWAFISTLVTQLLPVGTVILIAFPSVTYWLRSILGPLNHIMK